MGTACTATRKRGIFAGKMVGLTYIFVTIHVVVVRIHNKVQPCPFRMENHSNAVVPCSVTIIVVHSECRCIPIGKLLRIGRKAVHPTFREAYVDHMLPLLVRTVL